MFRQQNPNVEVLEIAANSLGSLATDLVFLGGEDIVAVLDGRPEVVNNVQGSPEELRTYLALRFQQLLEDARFIEAVSGHLPADGGIPGRVKMQ